MKKILLSLFISIIGTGMHAQAQNEKPIKIKLTLNCEIAAPKKDCQSGFGICHLSVTPGRMVNTGLNLENGVLTFYFNRSSMGEIAAAEFRKNVYFPIDETSTLSTEVWSKLGQRSERTLRPGNYKIQTTADYYIVSVPIE